MAKHRSTNRDVVSRWLDSDAATAILRVKKATLYTYVSRGWLRTRDTGSRTRLYHREDVMRLAARGASHSGRLARASEALAWGAPVLDSTITRIDPVRGPLYRGVPASELASVGTPFEVVADWLCDVEDDLEAWPVEAVPQGVAAACDVAEHTLDRWAIALSCWSGPDDPVGGARTWVQRFVSFVAPARSGTVAGRLARSLGCPEPLIEAALVLCADHELNPSTFTARVAAAAGADLASCLKAALATFSGTRHGTASLQLAREPELLKQQLQGTSPPGFDHPLYPDGDPRGRLLLDLVWQHHPDHPLRALEADARARDLEPNIDFALLALCDAYCLDRSWAPRLFAIGRLVGWCAHIAEQRRSPGLIRPRARAVD